ncbi:MAG: ABC transporter family substrate-binding protein [Corynebacterium sp.]|nr:ABC transporter family substrate-binding protein [Corynebacterium sp.]
MKKPYRVAVVALLSATALILGACSSSSNKTASTDSAGGVQIKPAGDYNPLERDQIKDGGEFKLSIAEITEQSNTFHGNATAGTATLWRWYNPQLTLSDGDGTWHANPAYLTNVKDEEVDGKTVITYDIHPDAIFNDDTPIDWKAFENTWKFNNGENQEVVANSTDGYDLIESVTQGENEKQAVVTFKQPYPWWQGLFANVVHPAVADAQTFNEGYIKNPHPEWGAGPFKIETFDYNSGNVTFVPNEKWWGDKPKLDKVSFRQMEAQATINAFQSGEIDVAGASTKDTLAVAKGMSNIDIRGALLPANELLTLNSQAATLNDSKVREAIFTGIDRGTLAQLRFNGLDYTEKLPGSLLLYQTQPGYEDNYGELIKYNEEKAKQLLDEAGWVVGGDGIREKDGKKLTLRYVSFGDNPLIKSIAIALQKMLKDLGADMQIIEKPSSEFQRVLAEKDFDVLLSGYGSSDPFGVAYFKQDYGSDSTLNKSGTGTPEFDEKIKELQQIPNQEEQIAKANELEKEAVKMYGVLPYANGPQLVAVKKGLANYGAYSFAILPKESIGWAK